MSDEVLNRNRELLEEGLIEGKLPERRHDVAIGSFFQLLFDTEHEDCIPLFFEYLEWKFGKDYSHECEWVQECLEHAHKEYEAFKDRVEEDPILQLLIALSD